MKTSKALHGRSVVPFCRPIHNLHHLSPPTQGHTAPTRLPKLIRQGHKAETDFRIGFYMQDKTPIVSKSRAIIERETLFSFAPALSLPISLPLDYKLREVLVNEVKFNLVLEDQLHLNFLHMATKTIKDSFGNGFWERQQLQAVSSIPRTDELLLHCDVSAVEVPINLLNRFFNIHVS